MRLELPAEIEELDPELTFEYDMRGGEWSVMMGKQRMLKSVKMKIESDNLTYPGLIKELHHVIMGTLLKSFAGYSGRNAKSYAESIQ